MTEPVNQAGPLFPRIVKRGPAYFLVAIALGALVSGQERPGGQGFSFRTGVELINVTATVTDEHGRFVPGLTADDFLIYEDGKPQVVQQFDNERVPVSLGIALDTSGSMVGEKMTTSAFLRRVPACASGMAAATVS
jgi:hypothetical protein